MTLITHAEAPVFDIPGATFTAYAAPSRGASQVSLWSVELAAGTSSAPHCMDVEELFLGQSGAAVAVVDGTEHPIGPGDCLVLEAGAMFSFRVGADEAFRAVACMRTGGRATLDGETFAPPWTV
jgi:mannose-6-phosphate isomerase-like protein (cupin superfamily)